VNNPQLLSVGNSGVGRGAPTARIPHVSERERENSAINYSEGVSYNGAGNSGDREHRKISNPKIRSGGSQPFLGVRPDQPQVNGSNRLLHLVRGRTRAASLRENRARVAMGRDSCYLPVAHLVVTCVRVARKENEKREETLPEEMHLGVEHGDVRGLALSLKSTT